MSTTTIQPVPVEDDTPVLELVETSYDEVEAAPAPPPARWRLWVKKIAQISAVLFAVLAYPVSVVASHDLNDSPVALPVAGWTANDIGVAATLIERELSGPGWADDKALWHPQSRLTALPAWQDGLAGAIGDWVGARAIMLEQDGDLSSAARLLYPEPGSPMTPRLTASLEAMRRFDGRVTGGFAMPAEGTQMLKDDMALMAEWASTSLRDLAIVIREAQGVPTDPVAIRTFYIAKARAHAAYHLLSAIGYREDDTLRALMAKPDWAGLVDLWGQASGMSPFLVSNLTGDGMFNPNHLAVMAFYMSQIEQTSAELSKTFSETNEATADPA